MSARLRVLGPILLALWLAACAMPPAGDDALRTYPVHIRSNGWHTAILVPRAAVAASGLVPEAAQFPDAALLEFGWGDRDYYTARAVTPGLALRAALLPTPAVLHMAGWTRLPDAGRGGTMLHVALTEAGFRALVAAIADSFVRPAGGPAPALGPGLSANSRFYPARGRFHLLNTCNTWTVRMLRAGGVAVSPAGVVTARDAIARLRAVPGTTGA